MKQMLPRSKLTILDVRESEERADVIREDLNTDAILAREELRHLEMMAATIAGGMLACDSNYVNFEKSLRDGLRDSIAAAQQIRDEQNRAGTEGKAVVE